LLAANPQVGQTRRGPREDSVPSPEGTARRELEHRRGAAFSDEEWAAAKYRILALAKLVRRWVKAA
jgi:hypothetical protein